MWSWEDTSIVFIYSTVLTRNLKWILIIQPFYLWGSASYLPLSFIATRNNSSVNIFLIGWTPRYDIVILTFQKCNINISTNKIQECLFYHIFVNTVSFCFYFRLLLIRHEKYQVILIFVFIFLTTREVELLFICLFYFLNITSLVIAQFKYYLHISTHLDHLCFIYRSSLYA